MAKYILPIEVQALEEGGYLARSPALPGFLVQADTIDEVMNLSPGVAQALIECMREKGVPLPKAALPQSSALLRSSGSVITQTTKGLFR